MNLFSQILMKFRNLFLVAATIALACSYSVIQAQQQTDTENSQLNNPQPKNYNARIIGYAPGPHDSEINYNAPTEGKYSTEYLAAPFSPPADTGRDDPKKAIVISRDTAELDSEDFTKFKFIATPTPLPAGSTITLTISGSLNLYKDDKSLVAPADMTYTVPASPDSSNNWIKKAALEGSVEGWARGKADWGQGGSFTLTITPPPNGGNAKTATLQLVARRHVVIVAGGSSHNKDYAHAIEIRSSPTADAIHLSSNLKASAGAVALFTYKGFAFDGADIKTLNAERMKALKEAVSKINRAYPAHDNYHLNFLARACLLAKQLVQEGCEVHLVVNEGAATRRNSANTYPGLNYGGSKWIARCPNFDKPKAPTMTLVRSASTNFKAASGKGKSNPYRDAEGKLGVVFSDISKKIKIDDVLYIGHSGGSAPIGSWFFEYGSQPTLNDAWQLVGGDRTGECRSLEVYAPPAIASKATFNSGNDPRLLHCGCNGANGAASFCEQAAVSWGVKFRGCTGKTDYVGTVTESFLIPCDGRTINLEIPKPSTGTPGAPQPVYR